MHLNRLNTPIRQLAGRLARMDSPSITCQGPGPFASRAAFSTTAPLGASNQIYSSCVLPMTWNETTFLFRQLATIPIFLVLSS